uniref:F-box domain-containing protein n=1 Tax=Oryza glumipatula TaxID=40148 RepID=A0A0D9ZHB8_9ORYZ
MATRSALPPRRRGLPEEIVVWEILVRLPPKPLLRCRLVCRAWRRLTSTRDFLLAHHRHQPSLPLVVGYGCDGGSLLDILTLDRRDAARPGLHPVARLKNAAHFVSASCDGILILNTTNYGEFYYSVCNPTTRQFADLPMLTGFFVMGFYQHRPTGEYRLLLYYQFRPEGSEDRYACYVCTLGSSEMPRCIGWMEEVATSMDYKTEFWSLKHRVELPVPDIKGKLDDGDDWSAVVLSEDGDVLVLVYYRQWLLYIGTNGKLLASFQHDVGCHYNTPLKLKQSLVPHAFFPLLKGYVVNARPFI